MTPVPPTLLVPHVHCALGGVWEGTKRDVALYVLNIVLYTLTTKLNENGQQKRETEEEEKEEKESEKSVRGGKGLVKKQ